MPNNELIHNYLKSLAKYLSRLNKVEADEVIREIESHIYDALDIQEQNGQEVNAANILDGFGTPRELANQYVEHLLHGMAPPKGFRAIQTMKKGVTKSLYFSMGVFGFSCALFLILLGLIKALLPNEVGVWSTAQGNSIIISFSQSTAGNTNELFGYWLIPIVIGTGIGCAVLTRRVLGILKQSI